MFPSMIKTVKIPLELKIKEMNSFVQFKCFNTHQQALFIILLCFYFSFLFFIFLFFFLLFFFFSLFRFYLLYFIYLFIECLYNFKLRVQNELATISFMDQDLVFIPLVATCCLMLSYSTNCPDMFMLILWCS